MYIYQIINTINGKIYIGQTNNIQKRWSNHKCGNDKNMVIARAIKKYGVENFKFEVLLRNLSPEEANEKEIEYIALKNSRVPNGYNVASGGQRVDGISRLGADNSNAHLTEAEAQYVLDHRNQPMYVLYEEVSDKLTYEQFKKLYHHKTYQNLQTNVPEYPYNQEFSNQFCKKGLEYDEVVDIRNRYANGEYWRYVYKDYKHIYSNEWSFWNAYNGNSYKLVMPEVFTPENIHLHAGLAKSGQLNGRAKLTVDDVKNIRKMWHEGVKRYKIQEMYPQISNSAINRVIRGDSWKNVL